MEEPFIGTCEDDTSIACVWVALHNKLKDKKMEKVSIKIFLKRNLADVGMAQS